MGKNERAAAHPDVSRGALVGIGKEHLAPLEDAESPGVTPEQIHGCFQPRAPPPVSWPAPPSVGCGVPGWR